MASKTDSMSLYINIVSARGLSEIDPISKTEIYVVVSIITGAAQNEQSVQTNVCRDGGGNPTWNFPSKFAVDVDRLKQLDLKTRLFFALKCEDGRGERDLGEVQVAIAELFQSAGGDGNSVGFAAVSYPIRKPSGQTVGMLNFDYKFSTSDTPAAGYALRTRNMGVYPPQEFNYPPPPPAAGYSGYPPPPAAGYSGHLPPPQSTGPYPPPSLSHYTPPPYPPPSLSHYTPPPYPPYNVGPSLTAPPSPSHCTPPSTYPPYNFRPPAPSPPSHYMPPPPYPAYNVGPSAAPPYAHPYPPHPSHVQARAPPVEQRSVPKKKKSVWGSALEMAGEVAVGVLSGVAVASFELPSVPAPDVSDLTGGLQIPDPSAYAPTDFSFINTLPDPSALRDATYVDYSSLV